jgi:hypothetical protein
MVDPFKAAAPAFFKAFADPERIIYTQDGVVLEPIRAIWTDDAAASFFGAGGTLRKLTYEIQQSDLPKRPSKTRDTFTHNGRRWAIEEVICRNDIGAWWLVVADAGAAL